MGWRINQNGLAHSPKWTSTCMIHYTCVYIRAGWRLFAKAPSPLEYIRMYGVSCMRWSILANAPVHFIECACLFWRTSYSILCFYVCLCFYIGIQLVRHKSALPGLCQGLLGDLLNANKVVRPPSLPIHGSFWDFGNLLISF